MGLALLCLVLYVPGLTSLPPVDRDEARFAQATKQMVAGGDYVRPRFQDADRFRKPIGIYWLQAASVGSLSWSPSPGIWAYRVPSVVGALVAVLLTFRLGSLLFAPAAALLGSALLAASLLLLVEAHLATTDAALLACVVAAQGCLGVMYTSARRQRTVAARYALGFWLAQGAGILLKGPVTPLLSGLTLIALLITDRRGFAALWRQLHFRWGIPMLLLTLLPWMIAIAHATDGQFFTGWIGGDLLPKMLGEHESHGGPPGLHLLLLPLTFWPASLGLIVALLHARRHRSRPAERFCIAWIVPFWALCELLPTKLPHYVLPTFPALALIVGRSLPAHVVRPLRSFERAGLWGWLVVTGGLAAGTFALPLLLDSNVSAANVIGGLVLSIGAGAVVLRSLAGRWNQAALVGLVSAALWAAISLEWLLPGIDRLWLSRSVDAAVRSRGANVRLAAVGYHEPSLVFLSGTETLLLGPDEAARFLMQGNGNLVLVSEETLPAFSTTTREAGLTVNEVWSGDGLHYSKGRWTRLRLFGRVPAEDGR